MPLQTTLKLPLNCHLKCEKENATKTYFFWKIRFELNLKYFLIQILAKSLKNNCGELILSKAAILLKIRSFTDIFSKFCLKQLGMAASIQCC